MVQGIAVAVVAAVLFGLAGWLYQAFPHRRREVCYGSLAVGGLGLVIGAVFSNVASDEVREAYGAAMLIVMGLGLLGAFLGLILLQKLNREGEGK